MGRKTGTRDLRNTIAIVGDGHVEKYYFEDMRDHEDTTGDWYQILPRLPEKSGNFDKAINKAISLLNREIDKVFAIVDMDKVLSDGKKNEFLEKQKEIAKLNKKKDGKICLCYCNPCFEYWLLLHFKFIKNHFKKCQKIENELVNQINNYKKSQKYHSKVNLYKKLYPKLNTAITNSEKSEKSYIKQSNDYHPISTIHKIFYDLRIGTNY